MIVRIIIPLYNHERYVSDCIRSCLEQTYQDIEILVIDDCSTDRSFAIADCYSKNERVLVLKNMENIGYTNTINRGIRYDGADFIVVLDSDNFLTPKSIELRVQAFREKPILDMVHGFAYSITTENYDECLKGTFRKHGRHDDRIHDQTVMLRKSVYYKCGLWYDMGNPMASSDKEYWYRLGVHPFSPLSQQVKAKKLDSFLCYYRKDVKSMKYQRNEKQKKYLRGLLDKRVETLKREGITRENTPWL